MTNQWTPLQSTCLTHSHSEDRFHSTKMRRIWDAALRGFPVYLSECWFRIQVVCELGNIMTGKGGYDKKNKLQIQWSHCWPWRDFQMSPLRVVKFSIRFRPRAKIVAAHHPLLRHSKVWARFLGFMNVPCSRQSGPNSKMSPTAMPTSAFESVAGPVAKGDLDLPWPHQVTKMIEWIC